MTNIEELRLDKRDVHFFFKIKCTNCQEIFPKWQSIELNNTISNGKQTVNHRAICKLCNRPSTVCILKEKIDCYREINNDNFHTISVFDCRGCELIEYDFRSLFKVISKSGLEIDDVPLVAKEWADYDEEEQCPLAIDELKFKLEKL